MRKITYSLPVREPALISKMFKVDELVKSPNSVTPAKAGVQNCLKLLDSGSGPERQKRENLPFYDFIKVGSGNPNFSLAYHESRRRAFLLRYESHTIYVGNRRLDTWSYSWGRRWHCYSCHLWKKFGNKIRNGDLHVSAIPDITQASL